MRKKIPYAGHESIARRRNVINAKLASELRASGMSWREIVDTISTREPQFAVDSVMGAVKRYRDNLGKES